MKLNKISIALIAAGVIASPLAYATNGMLMEGYGPIATGMGGASMAYDNGDAGMANNPATLGLMADGSRLDLSVGGLHPNVAAKMPTFPDAKSGGESYFMPAGGWITKKNNLTYGVGVFAQGGMGTEYKATDWLAGTSGKAQRSEVGVGNMILPLAYNVSPDLIVAGSVDLVWSGMDLQMGLDGNQMSGLASQGNLTATGSAAGGLTTFMGGGQNSVGYFDFSDDSKFTGKAQSTGYAGKLGATYKISKQLTLGATYHSKTHLGDMTTNGATMSMISSGTTVQTITGKVSVIDFQFPENYAIGAAYQATDDLMVVADYKHIGWKDAMKNFHMTFVANDGSLNLDMKMPQNWTDQDVFQFGFAYKATTDLTLRAGANLASNPVPDDTVNPLFPAIIKNHYTLGAGYAINKVSSVNAALVYAPTVSVTAPATAGGYTIEHSQMNWQLMYSRNM